MWRRRTVQLRWKRLGALTTGIKLHNGNWLHLVNNIPAGDYELVEINRSSGDQPPVRFHGYYQNPDEARAHVQRLLSAR